MDANHYPGILLIHTYYPEFLRDHYATNPSLAHQSFDAQRKALLDTAFCLTDSYSHYLAALGWQARDLIVNADIMQARWAKEHGLHLDGNIHDRRRRILAAQIEHFRPEALYVFEWCPLGDAFLSAIKPRVRLIAGQVASPLPDDRTYEAYDVMFSSWPPIVEFFRSGGKEAELLRLGFDPRVLEKLPDSHSDLDVSFVGGFAPSHPDRIAWLERLMDEVPIDIYGYGVENTSTGSPIRHHHRGHAWGRRMYETLKRSKVTLNRHARIALRGRVTTHLANNMRLYEATGVGTCLLTDHKENLRAMFEPEHEIITYTDEDECVEKIRYLLDHDATRVAVAEAGQRRTLKDHTYAGRMEELSEMLLARLY